MYCTVHTCFIVEWRVRVVGVAGSDSEDELSHPVGALIQRGVVPQAP